LPDVVPKDRDPIVEFGPGHVVIAHGRVLFTAPTYPQPALARRVGNYLTASIPAFNTGRGTSVGSFRVCSRFARPLRSVDHSPIM
jgi:hypothetical protein